ncbi:DUF1295 domain-containing protein [Gordonia sp. NPDC003585]|uniref:DUF1295 domain-containing protein n=1 Tax=Gordonia sp. NPDC003585 TaxID=3154275 RepID=UPI0033B43B36
MSGWSGFVVVTVAALLLLTVIQGVAMLIGHRIGRYNVVDVVWGLGFVGVAWLAVAIGDGDATRRWLLAILTSVWGLRLSWHMHVKSRGRGEDPRYTALLERAGAGSAASGPNLAGAGSAASGPNVAGGNGLGIVARKIFATQGASQWFVSLPIQVSAVLGSGGTLATVLTVVGTLLWVGGFGFEAIGDAQLRRFKSDPANKGVIMDRGLWSWTRHPNYFGDACVWWGMWIIAASVWPGVLTLLSPIAMTYFLVYATGARLLEQSMSKRPGYPEYQARTSYFLPRPPRKVTAAP